MEARIKIKEQYCFIDLEEPLSIGIPLDPFGPNPTCFYADQPKANPMNFKGYVCSVEAGAPINFFTLHVTPHGNGTHTESVGHISKDLFPINKMFNRTFFTADLISVTPLLSNGDKVLKTDFLNRLPVQKSEALVIRTWPNSIEKRTQNYTDTNPPYLAEETMNRIVDLGYKHLLLDLPSVDREQDDGVLKNHKTFWASDSDETSEKTITEMIYVPNEIQDGLYILQLNVSNINLDAVPSHPVLYRVKKSVNC